MMSAGLLITVVFLVSLLIIDAPELGPLANTQTLIGIGAGLAARPLPHHRAYGSVHGGSDQLIGDGPTDGRPRERK